MDLSPRRLEHQVYIPTAITLSRLNPQPARSHFDSRKETFNSLKAKEIDNAQTKARHVILRSRLEENEIPHLCQCQGNVCTCRDISENTKLQSDEVKPVNAEKLVKKDSNPKTKVSFNVAIGKGESNMRIRQVTRLANQICDCIKEIEDTRSIKTITKEFITPYELQVKKKRFEDYLNSGRRTLFTLKREINHLEGHVSLKKKDCKWLRILSTVSRTLHQLLLGLKNLSDSVLSDSVGLIFYKELLRTSWRLFSVASTIDIKFTKQDVLKKLDSQFSKVENTVMDKPPTTHYESSIDTSSDLLHSSLDDKSLALLHPSNIRRRIAALAKVSLSNKKNKTNGSDIKVLAPLSLIRMPEEDEPEQKKYVKRRTKKNLKRSVSQQRGISHSSDNDQIEIVPEKRKNVSPSPTILSFSSNTIDPKYSDITNHKKDILSHHTMEERNKQNYFPRHQEQVSPEALMTQIHYLHERVCKINEDWEETEKMIDEFRSNAHEEDPQVTHQIILNEAQRLLRELQIEAAKSSSSEFQNENCVIFEQEKKKIPRTKSLGNPFMNQNTLKNDNSLRSNSCNTEEKYSYMHRKHIGNPSESTFYLSLNTIQDQVRTEKEQFWAALVKRGIVAADHPIPIETNVISDLVDHAKEKGIGKDVSLERQMEQIYINSQIKDGESNKVLPINVETLNKKVQTKPFKEKVKLLIEKEIQVGSGISKSYSTSFVTETECSNTYENQTKPPETSSKSLQPLEHILSYDDTYTDTENLSSNITGEQLQKNSELCSLNDSSFNSVSDESPR